MRLGLRFFIIKAKIQNIQEKNIIFLNSLQMLTILNNMLNEQYFLK